MKNIEFDYLLKEMAYCNCCTNMKKRNGKDCSLVNIYKEGDFCKKIPSIWTDWYRRLDSDIMIIGQDWGPYQDMKEFYGKYILNETSENWDMLIEQEKSLTKKLLTKYIIDSARLSSIDLDSDYLNQIFITNAIMCARRGENYRGDNIKLKDSTLFCSCFLKKQVEIVKPKIILTLGYYPLFSLSHIFSFRIEKSLSRVIEKTPEILIDDFVIIPLYHPTAQIKREKQLEQYIRMWKYI